MTILREVTNAKHREVEALPLIQTIMQGNITKEQYVCYLFELANIYDVLETLAMSKGLLDGLDGLERTEKLHQDLEELDSNYHRVLTQSTLDYIAYLSSLASNKEKSHLLFAHIYVRHMGDLYGGKLMARVVPGSGRCYQFDDRPGIIKKFNEKLTMDLGDEANKAFDFFINIFTDLYKLMQADNENNRVTN
jgi:heme oxygenase